MPDEIISNSIFSRGLPITSLHGPEHWRRVEKFGLLIAEKEGADKQVVSWFACLHDARREHDGDDPDHGRRAAELLDELRAANLAPLSDQQYQSLRQALAGHNNTFARSTDINVLACWDADRLDLWRADIEPDPRYMFTATGKSREMIALAALENGREYEL